MFYLKVKKKNKTKCNYTYYVFDKHVTCVKKAQKNSVNKQKHESKNHKNFVQICICISLTFEEKSPTE